MLWWMGYDCFVLMCHQWLWCYMASVLVNKRHCDCMQTIQIDSIYCEARTMVTEWSIYSDQYWSSQYSYKHILLLWASSTDLTAVSKFKPHQPAQWALGTDRKGPSRMEKVTSRMNWPIRNSTQIRNKILHKDNTIMGSLSFFCISNRFYRTLNNFGNFNDHIITEFSWVVSTAPAVLSADILRWHVTS